MATRTKPLVSAATLASAAAVAVAGTAIAPSLNLPTPHALTAAKVQLATFADVLSVPAVEWTDLLFGNTTWGGVLTTSNYGDASAAPQDVFGQTGYVNPWVVYCDGGCTRTNIPGALYLFTDALVNGNGKGYDNVNEWNTGVVNYFWEPSATIPLGGGSSPTFQIVDAGLSSASWYLLQTTLGKAIPALTVPLAAAFWGPENFSVFYNLGLTAIAGVLGQVPLVGPITGNSILAYLGDLEIPNSGGSYYQYGLSGTLNYWVDIATGAAPFPTTVGSAAATRAAAASLRADAATAAPAAASSVKASETPEVSNDSKPASTPESKAPESTPAADVVDNTPKAPETTPEVKATESTPEVETSKSTSEATESTPEVETPKSTSEAPQSTPEVEAPESTPASVDTPAASTATAKPTRPHPVRDAVEKVGKQISAALNGAKPKASAAKDASRGSDSAS